MVLLIAPLAIMAISPPSLSGETANSSMSRYFSLRVRITSPITQFEEALASPETVTVCSK